MAWFNPINSDIVNGDRPYGSYWQEIPDRPSIFHTWNGVAWVFNQAASDAATALFARMTTDELERIVAMNDGAILALINQDKTAWIAWVTANLSFVTAPADRTRMGTILWVLSVAVRKVIRQ